MSSYFKVVRLIFFTVVILLITTLIAAQDDNSLSVRALWNGEIFVVLNNSDEAVDLTGLSFSSANGEITPDNWVMSVNDETGLPYGLNDVAPGSCLAAYFVEQPERPALPGDVSCTRFIGEFTPTSYGDLVWDVSQGGFSAAVDGITVSECSIESTSCDIAVRPATEMMMMDEERPAETTISVLWNADILVVLNTSDYGVDVSELTFKNDAGEIAPDNWVIEINADTGDEYNLANFRPGSCLISYFVELGSQPDLPENVSCTRIEGVFTPIEPTDVVWEVSAGGFEATVAGNPAGSCTMDSTTCDVTVPTSAEDAGDMMDETMDDMSDVSIRAIWTQDILVLINVSDVGVDLSGLDLESASGAVQAMDWMMNLADNGDEYALDDVRPGSCLVVYFVEMGEQPPLPENVSCTRTIGAFTPATLDDLIWDVNGGGFTPIVAGVEGDACSVGDTTTCDIVVPSSEE